MCFITAGPITKLFAWGGRRVEDMCYERRRAEDDRPFIVLTETKFRPVWVSPLPRNNSSKVQSLLPLVWESDPKLQGGWCKPNHQADRGSDPNHRGIWSPPRAGSFGDCLTPNCVLGVWGLPTPNCVLGVCLLLQYYYKAVRCELVCPSH